MDKQYKEPGDYPAPPKPPTPPESRIVRDCYATPGDMKFIGIACCVALVISLILVAAL